MYKAFLFSISLFVAAYSSAQSDVYTTTAGGILFSGADFQAGTPTTDINTKMRFTAWYHVGEFINMDFTNNFGLFSGMEIKNIGLIIDDADLKIEKNVHRSYSIGIPLAFKLGAFDKNTYLYAGGEYEWLFHYKHKYWIDGKKHKTSEWFSNKTKTFLPSVFVGLQFPYGANIQFKYYLDDFLNHDYKRGKTDFTSYKKSQIFYICLSYRIPTKDIVKTRSSSQKTYAKR